MRDPAYQFIKRSLVWAGVCAGAGAFVLLPDLVARRPVGVLPLVVGAGTMLAALVLFIRGWRAADALGRGVQDVRTAVLNVVADRTASFPASLAEKSPPEIRAMLESLAVYQDEITRERQGPDRRLVAVVGSFTSGVVVITEQGQVSLVNGPARELLGAERVRVGTSVFATLGRDSVLAAMDRARKAGRPLEALLERLDGVTLQGQVSPLPEDEGAILLFPPVELARHRPGVEFDLELHDVPPAAAPLTMDMSLDDLPMVVVDVETTGLDVLEDRIVSLGAVCAHGHRLFRSRMLDALVDPGVPIPTASTSVHGITDAMVADAPRFPEVWSDFERLARNRVVVGHNVSFDLTILREECRRYDRPWEDFVFLDTLRLASLLNPTQSRLDLGSLARHYQINVHGRHTALGDALLAAELLFRMFPRLQQQGLGNLGALLEFHGTRAVDVIAGQRERNWITHQPEHLRPG